MLIYALLKTEGDVLFELKYYDQAIKAYKTLRDFCLINGKSFDNMRMIVFEQLAICYRTEKMFSKAIMYEKKALCVAYDIGDPLKEIIYY
jgi:tetratricopeptide (TPR) repeat protein